MGFIGDLTEEIAPKFDVGEYPNLAVLLYNFEKQTY